MFDLGLGQVGEEVTLTFVNADQENTISVKDVVIEACFEPGKD